MIKIATILYKKGVKGLMAKEFKEVDMTIEQLLAYHDKQVGLIKKHEHDRSISDDEYRGFYRKMFWAIKQIRYKQSKC